MSITHSSLKVTTFNALNNPARWEERYTTFLDEVDDTGSSVLLLQEVLEVNVEKVEKLASRFGFYLTKGDMWEYSDNPERNSGQVTLSKEKPLSSWSISYPDIPKNSLPVLVTEFENYFTINVHLAWGEDAEIERMETVYQVTQLAKDLKQAHPDRIIILGGDFNATPESPTMRFLHGLEFYKGISTYWTNGWAVGERFPTARKDGGWAETTALGKNIIRPDLMPDRTIDNLLTYGWNYGKVGSPLELSKFGVKCLDDGFATSDHYGVTVDFLVG